MDKQINPFTRMLSTFDPRYFYGREMELATILQGITAPEPSSFLIIGMRSIGKTTLLKYLAHKDGARHKHNSYVGAEYAPGGPGVLLFVYLNFRTFGRGDSVFQMILRRLQAEIERNSLEGIPTVTPEPQDKTALIDTLRLSLERLATQEVRVVFLMDEFDTVVLTMDEEDDGLLRTLGNAASFVLATEEAISELRPEIAEISPFLGILVPRVIGLLDEESAKELITDPAEKAERPFTSEEMGLILENGGRQPFLLTAVCEQFLEWRTRHKYSPATLHMMKDKSKAQLTLGLARLPHISETFSLFRKKMSAPEREVAYSLAVGTEIDVTTKGTVIQSLANKALVYGDLEGERYRIFSNLFADFIVQQHDQQTARSAKLTGSDIERIAEGLAQLDRQLLTYLLAHTNETCAFQDLLQDIWGDPQAKRALEASIHRIRRVLASASGQEVDYIKNMRGVGYQLVLEGSSSKPNP